VLQARAAALAQERVEVLIGAVRRVAVVQDDVDPLLRVGLELDVGVAAEPPRQLAVFERRALLRRDNTHLVDEPRATAEGFIGAARRPPAWVGPLALLYLVLERAFVDWLRRHDHWAHLLGPQVEVVEGQCLAILGCQDRVHRNAVDAPRREHEERNGVDAVRARPQYPALLALHPFVLEERVEVFVVAELRLVDGRADPDRQRVPDLRDDQPLFVGANLHERLEPHRVDQPRDPLPPGGQRARLMAALTLLGDELSGAERLAAPVALHQPLLVGADVAPALQPPEHDEDQQETGRRPPEIVGEK